VGFCSDRSIIGDIKDRPKRRSNARMTTMRFKDGIRVKVDGDYRIVTLANKVAIAGHGALIFSGSMSSARLLSRLKTYQQRRQQQQEHSGTALFLAGRRVIAPSRKGRRGR
jgi:hypothetical protein